MTDSVPNVPDGDRSQELLRRYRAGDVQAATAIHDKYLRRLIGLAQTRLSSQLAARVDPEDIVQSAYRSFFIRARDGDFVLQRAGDLWRLLAQITLNKLYSQAQHHTAQRRSVARERRPDLAESSALADPGWADSNPTPAEAAASIEQLQLVMRRLTPMQRAVLQRRLQGETIEDIATAVERSQRTVRRLLEQVRVEMTTQLGLEP